MKSIQLIKQLNNTELGKSGTHDCYILVPQTVDVSDIFPEEDTVYQFVDRETGSKFPIRHTNGREKRIVGFGPYYSSKQLCAGDKIIVEFRSINDQETRILDYARKLNTLVVQKTPAGFELLTPDRLALVNENVKVKDETLTVDYLLSKKKRQDSPTETDYYDIKVGDQSIIENYATKEYAVIEIENYQARIEKFCSWNKVIIKAEDEQ